MRRYSRTFVIPLLVSILIAGFLFSRSNKTLPPVLNLSAPIQSIYINDDSPGGGGWIPKNGIDVLSQVLPWIKTAGLYTGKVPQSVEFSHHGYLGPSRLHIVISGTQRITIYPAYYIVKNGKTDTAASVDDRGVITRMENPEYQLEYAQDVLVFDNGVGRTYIKSVPLYNWLKNNQWKSEFERG